MERTLEWAALMPEVAEVGVLSLHESELWDWGHVQPLDIIASADHPSSKQEVVGVASEFTDLWAYKRVQGPLTLPIRRHSRDCHGS